MLTRSTLPAVLFILAAAASLFAQPPVPSAQPAPVKGLKYDADFFPGSQHDANIPTPDSVIGFRVGDKPAMHAQVEAVLKALAAKSPRVKLFEYAKTHEGRACYYLAVSSEANIKNLDAIKASAAKLADPRAVSAGEADKIASSIPAIAWMAYVIHGDEMSSTDAALALAWHLASCTDEPVKKQLDELVVLIDPLMNPDGRDRCINSILQNRTVQPNIDEQSVMHSEVWPSGRMNHYLFDMNRDWVWGTQPESRGRIKAAGEWNPHYFVEGHEQGDLDTFLFMPPRAPINPNIADSIHKWGTIFADDQGKAFDAHSWRYYTGEWNEEWYPGYSGSWGALRGAIDNLYEQARIQTDAVRRPEGTLETYRESVHKQLVSSLANLSTLQKNRAAIVKDFVEEKRKAVSDAAPFGNRLFVIAGAFGNGGRWERFDDLLALQGIESYQLTAELKASGHDWLGREFKDRAFAPGTVVVPARQPLGRLAAAILELDPRMSPEFLTEERRELLRFGQSRLYDITGWNAAMMFGIDIFEIDAALPTSVRKASTQTGDFAPRATDLARADSPPRGTDAPAGQVGAPVAWFADGTDDRAIALAARLMDRGVKIRCVNKPTKLSDIPVPRGSIFVTRKDNQDFAGDLGATIAETTKLFNIPMHTLTSGMGKGDNPDLGGQHFVLLETPRIAVLTRDPFNPYTVGEAWHLIDHELGIRAAFLNTQFISGVDLRRYNVLVVPDGGPDGWADKVPVIKTWVEQGGTLIAIGSSAGPFCKDKDGIGSTRLLPDVLTKLDEFRAAIVRDYLGKTAAPDPAQVWSYNPPDKLEYPWTLGETEKPSDEEAKRRDQFRDLFMPVGALLATRTDDRHWLTAGCGEVLPVIYGRGPVLIPSSGGNAPILMGAFVPSTKPPAPKPDDNKSGSGNSKDGANNETKTDKPVAPSPAARVTDGKPSQPSKPAEPKPSDTGPGGRDTADKDDAKKDDKDSKKDDAKKDETPKPGWLLAPPGFELRLRMSGLVWPEAADRIAHSAYCTQERIGNGQIILFANSPTFRCAARGSTRVMMNALVCGPGMGASQPIRP